MDTCTKVNGTGPFAALGETVLGETVLGETVLGETVFDDYWMYYLTTDMARAVELAQRPYINLKSYLEYKTRPTGG